MSGGHAEEGTAVEAAGAEPLGDREDHLAVRDGGEERLVEPEAPAGEPSIFGGMWQIVLLERDRRAA